MRWFRLIRQCIPYNTGKKVAPQQKMVSSTRLCYGYRSFTSGFAVDSGQTLVIRQYPLVVIADTINIHGTIDVSGGVARMHLKFHFRRWKRHGRGCGRAPCFWRAEVGYNPFGR